MKINKEGYKIIGLTGVVCFLLWALMYYLMSRHAEAGLLWFGSILLVLFWFFIVAFFREPRRVKIHDAELVFAPCDGRVVVTEWYTRANTSIGRCCRFRSSCRLPTFT